MTVRLRAVAGLSVALCVLCAGVLAPAGRASESTVPAVTVVAPGTEHTCAMTNVGGAYCWGDGQLGDLGNGATSQSSTPVAVKLPTGAKATAIASGQDYSCAATSAGAFCWGWNGYGQLGAGTTTNSSTPVAVKLPSGATATGVAIGNHDACAVTSAGGVYCWGESTDGQLGNGATLPDVNAIPVAVGLPAGVRATAITAGDGFSCAVTSAGGVYCWGGDTDGALGAPIPLGQSTSLTPLAVGLPSGVRVTAIASAALGSHTCAVTSAGGVYCWGDNSFGQLGMAPSYVPDCFGSCTITPVAVQLPSGATATAIASGQDYSCAATSAGAFCWGENEYGQLGNGTTTASPTPVAAHLPSGVSATAIAANFRHTCAAVNAGGVYCWGENDFGELGNGTTNNSPTPVQVSGLPPQETLRVHIGGSHARVTHRGAAITLRCSGGSATSVCRGHISLTIRTHVGHHPKTITLGRANYDVQSGHGKPVTIQLTHKTQRLLQHAPGHHLRATATVTLQHEHTTHQSLTL